MATVVACEKCGKRLKVPDGITAPQARCPSCGAIISLAANEPANPTPLQPRKHRLQPEQNQVRGTNPLQDEEPRARKKDRVQQEPDEEIIESSAAEEEAPKEDRTRRKKKRKKIKKPVPTGTPAWVWWLVGAIPVLLLLGIFLVGLAQSGHGKFVMYFLIAMGLGLPVGVVILVISMIISSAVVGGIDFGEAHIVIPKAAALLFVVNSISLIPLVGTFLALPIWWAGLMNMFRLDFFEARMLVTINWGLNTIFQVFLIGAIISGMARMNPEKAKLMDNLPTDQAFAAQQIELFGARCEVEKDGDRAAVVSVSLAGSQQDERILALLVPFSKLRSLDLQRTEVTSVGLRALRQLPELEELNLSQNPQLTDRDVDALLALRKLKVLHLGGTQISDAGVQRLKGSRPGLVVER